MLKLKKNINIPLGTGRALKKWAVVKEVLREAGVGVDEVVTKQRNHALNQIKVKAVLGVDEVQVTKQRNHLLNQGKGGTGRGRGCHQAAQPCAQSDQGKGDTGQDGHQAVQPRAHSDQGKGGRRRGGH